jgi:ADP-ribose pyrophosphatase YjhB (NUDIX family)
VHLPATTASPRFCSACAGHLDTTGRHPVCTVCGRTHHRDPKVGAGAVVLDAEGRLLLVQRGVEPGRGLWALPAGYVDAGEDPREAAAREVLEETGIIVRCGAVIDVYPGGPPGGGASFFIAFLTELISGEPAAADDVLDARFFALDALPPLAFPSTHDVVRRLGLTRAGQQCCPAGPTPPG